MRAQLARAAVRARLAPDRHGGSGSGRDGPHAGGASVRHVATFIAGRASMHIVMIGAGYVGLVSGACFADFGHIVTCVDKDADRIAALQQGEVPIFEPGLAELVGKNMREERPLFSTKLGPAMAAAEAIFIAVGTPSRRGDGHADLTYVFQAAREIAAHLEGY